MYTITTDTCTIFNHKDDWIRVEDLETYHILGLLKIAQTKTGGLISKLLLKSGTNVEQNINDPYGDGDQSILLGTELEPQRHIVRGLFAMEGDIEHHMRKTSGLTSFEWNCIISDTKAVKKEVKHCSVVKNKRNL